MYEVVDQDGKSVGKVHVEDLKPVHERTASDEDSQEKQAEASPPEVSEEQDASTNNKRHSANARIPETEAHPRKRGRPRKARLAFSVDKRASEHWSQTALTSDHRNPVPVALSYL